MARFHLSHRAELGRRAERLVAEYLQARGFQIVGQNVRVGRLEIDLIARRRELLVFCEVRARRHDRLVAPAATIDLDRDWDVGLHVVFQDKASHDKYQVSERHKQFVEENRTAWKKVRVFDSAIAAKK